jgi:hypothetical protein
MDPVYRVKRDLQEKLELASQEHFGTKNIAWRRIKILCPWLHLMHLDLYKMSADDSQSLERVLQVLEAAKQLKTAATAKHTKADESEEKSAKRDIPYEQSDLRLSRQQAQSQLLARYKELIPLAHFINWIAVDVIGWPDDVIFYQSYNWTKSDCLRLIEAMPSIHFVHRQYCDQRLTSDEQIALKRQVSEFFMKYFRRRATKWSLVKEQFPGFHLSQTKLTEWTYRDAEMLHTLFRVFSERFPQLSLP